jgi:hypothetical protein
MEQGGGILEIRMRKDDDALRALTSQRPVLLVCCEEWGVVCCYVSHVFLAV